jgi:ankyrin repeat protein
VDLVEYLLEKKADINQATDDGTTPLFMAAQEEYADIVQLLVTRKANVNKSDANGVTPGLMACQEGYLDIVRILGASGANLDQAKTNGVTPLLSATYEMRTEVVRYLVESKCNVNTTPLKKSGRTPLIAAVQVGCLQLVKILLCGGAKTEQAIPDGTTPILMAVQQGNRDILQEIMQYGANVNVVDNQGYTPLLRAIHQQDPSLVQDLVHGNACVHQVTKSGSFHVSTTPLMLAAGKGNMEIAENLINAGADVNQSTSNGHHPLFYAARGGYTEVVQRLVELNSAVDGKPNRASPVYAAAKYGRLEIVRFLVEQCGADINALADDDSTAFTASTNLGEFKVAEYLARNSRVTNFIAGGKTPLDHLLLTCRHTGFERYQLVKSLVGSFGGRCTTSSLKVLDLSAKTDQGLQWLLHLLTDLARDKQRAVLTECASNHISPVLQIVIDYTAWTWPEAMKLFYPINSRF